MSIVHFRPFSCEADLTPHATIILFKISDDDMSLKASRVRIPGVTIIMSRKTFDAAETHAYSRVKRNPIDKKKALSVLLEPTNKYINEKNYK